MFHDGYLKLMSTNNIGAKYAFSLSNEELSGAISTMGEAGDDLLAQLQSDPILFRAKLAVLRFFREDAQSLSVLVGQIFQQRLATVNWISDIADILWKQGDPTKIAKALALVSDKKQEINLSQLNIELTDDERTILGYYLTIQNYIISKDNERLQDLISQLLQRSLTGGSQLIALERIK